MHEILFKAKRKDNNEWVEGGYVYDKYSKSHYITKQLVNTHQLIEVIPETICQYTGLDDKNGNKIFENDKVKYDSGLGGHETSIIYYDEQILSLNMKTNFGYFYNGLCNLKNKKNIELIGNVWDVKYDS